MGFASSHECAALRAAFSPCSGVAKPTEVGRAEPVESAGPNATLVQNDAGG